MKKHVVGTLALAALLLVQLSPLHAEAAPKPLIRKIVGHTTDRVGEEHYDARTLEEAARQIAEWMRSSA